MSRWISREAMAERRKRVAQLKAQGLSHSKIGMRLGITTGTSERDFKQYKKERKYGKATAEQQADLGG